MHRIHAVMIDFWGMFLNKHLESVLKISPISFDNFVKNIAIFLYFILLPLFHGIFSTSPQKTQVWHDFCQVNNLSKNISVTEIFYLQSVEYEWIYTQTNETELWTQTNETVVNAAAVMHNQGWVGWWGKSKGLPQRRYCGLPRMHYF